jgi:putative ABC transport system ATP-binding protein
MLGRTCVSPERTIVCQGLARSYRTASGTVEALHELDVSFDASGLTAIVGASGSGKSTLLRLLAGLEPPTRGSLRVDGRELAALSPAELRQFRRREVTYVTQKPADNLIAHLTVREQLGPARDPTELFEQLGVAHTLDKRPAALSGGEQARAAMALALLRGTRLVVADEPTAELDESSAQRVLACVRTFEARGTAFVFASHDESVIAAADTLVRLEHTIERRPRDNDLPVDPATGTAFALRGFSKRYGNVTAVEDATLELTPGTLTVLLGRSGSGKSTLLMLAAGWQSADRGTLEVDGRPVDPGSLDWRQLAYVPQRFGLAPELTIRENVEWPARLDGSLAERAAAIEGLLGELALLPLADRFPAETSVGQQQRAAIARALALEPRILLADEPTSHQDPGSRAVVWEALRAAAAGGATCLVATHEEQAVVYADRVEHIADGLIAEHG